ncbi:MAG: hypothetical protein QOJ16_3852 [Acidobacteriota bacterium]|nr:hypothetical protein [Acidobacteriota bacterium]
MARRGTLGRWLLLLALGIFLGVKELQAAVPLGGGDDLRLSGNRFQVVATWRTADGGSGVGHAIPLTADTGAFWFFAPGNVELLVKVLNACTPFGRFWVFAAGLTNVEVQVAVTDFATGKVETYTNAQRQAFIPVQDTGAFADCPDATPHACGQGTAAEVAATPRADVSAERLALVLGGGLTAWPWLYDRVRADMGAIRAQAPDLANVGFLPRIGTSTLILSFQPAAYAQIQAGTYHAWDCLNQWYSARPERLNSIAAVVLHLPGRYDMRRVRPEYAALPGVSVAELDSYTFPDPYDNGTFCATVDGATLHYYVRPNLATTVYYFTSQPGAAALFRDHYSYLTAQPTPSWVHDAEACFAAEVASCCALS